MHERWKRLGCDGHGVNNTNGNGNRLLENGEEDKTKENGWTIRI